MRKQSLGTSPISGADVAKVLKKSFWVARPWGWMRFSQSSKDSGFCGNVLVELTLQYYVDIGSSSHELAGQGGDPDILNGAPQSVFLLQRDYASQPPWLDLFRVSIEEGLPDSEMSDSGRSVWFSSKL